MFPQNARNEPKLSKKYFTLRAEIFANKKFCNFQEFWTFSRKYVTWNTLRCEFLKTFSRDIPIK